MSAKNSCPQCGAALPAEAVSRLCPACLLEAGLATSPASSTAIDANKTLEIPTGTLAEKAGSRIGPYKLLEQLGEGGCGVVYVAEQQEPVRRRVALKVIKLGMDTRQVIARFEAERQALALMDHPNIAKVLDAGATESGRPFFVMELVKGLPLTRYCDEHKLPTRDRLQIFIQVCHAIQHAHQKGIIHRDVKPSNILVADHDGVPVPKIIDFGIAKATTGQRLTDKTLYTAIEQFIGTPAYMSPEQANLSGLDIDTRSDIYSLGVLLYELLTGRTPFDARRLLDAGLEEVRRMIREEDPLRPSARLSTLDAAEQATVAGRRGSQPPRLLGLIRGDLDWIVMKTLEKDRNRRYETATGLAVDLQRFLDSEPIQARPPSRLYKLQRLVRRNRLAFAGATAFVLLLMVATAATSWLALRARRAESEQRQLRANEASLRLKESAARQTAEAETLKARRAQAEVELRLAQNLVAQGDARLGEGRLDRARPSYQDAAESFRKIGMNALPAELGIWQTLRLSPPPLNSWPAHTGAVKLVQFLRDGIHAISIGNDSQVREWDVRLGLPTGSMRLHGPQAQCAAASDNGKLIFAGSARGELELWDREAAGRTDVWKGHATNVLAVAISADGQLGASAAADGSATCWELAGHRPKFVLPGSVGKVNCLAFSSDRRLLASGGEDGLSRVWDLASGKAIVTHDIQGPIGAVSFSPTAHYFICGSRSDGLRSDFAFYKDGTFACVGVPSGGWSTHTEQNGGVSCVQYSPDASHLCLGCRNGSMELWDTQFGVNAIEFPSKLQTFWAHEGGVSCVAFSPNSRLALTGGIDGAIALWPAEPEDNVRKLAGLGGQATAIALSRDGQLAVAAATDGTNTSVGCLWETATGRQLRGWTNQSEALQLALSPGCEFLLSGHKDGSIVLRELDRGRVRHVFQGHSGPVAAVGFSDDERRVVSAGQDGTIRVWDILGGAQLLSLTNGSPVCAARFSPDHKTVLTVTEDGSLSVWDLAMGKTRCALATHQSAGTALAWSASGRRVLLSGQDGVLRVWDFDSAVARITFNCPHPPAVAAAFTPGEDFALIADAAGSISAWEIPSGRMARLLTLGVGSFGGNRALALSGDGQSLLLAGWSPELEVWDFSRVAQYAAFSPRLSKARKRLAENPVDSAALAAFGRWYSFCGVTPWGIALLEQARQRDEKLPHLEMARCYWRADDASAARREFDRALANQEAPPPYLRLCLSAPASQALARPVFGYRIEENDVVFELDPALYQLSVDENSEVHLAGEFNDWLQASAGVLGDPRPEWKLKRAGDGRYVLRKDMQQFRARHQWEFKFVIDQKKWVSCPNAASNIDHEYRNFLFIVPSAEAAMRF